MYCLRMNIGYIYILYLITTFVCIVIGSKNFSHLGNLKSLYFLSIISILQELFSAHDSWLNIPSYYFESRNIYVIVEFFVLLNFFRKVINNSKVKRFINLTQVISAIYLLTYVFITKSILINYSLFSVTECLIFLVLCIFLFVQFLQSDETDNLLKHPLFLVTSGIFILFGVSAPTYFLYDELNKTFPEEILFDFITAVGYIFYVVLVTFSFKWSTKKFN